MFRPDPPQGFSREQQQIIIGRPIIPLFSPPQGIGGEVTPTGIQLLQALFPPIADVTFNKYRFYHIKKNQAIIQETDMGLLLIDTLPVGTFIGTTGFDMRVFDSNGDAIPYEVQSANINVDGSGDIILWVGLPVVRDYEFIQVTYGKAGATDGQTPSAVWDTDYKMVLHLDSDFDDSTSNNNNATNNGTTSVPGKIGQARNFNGTSDFLRVLHDESLNITDKITLSAWTKSIDVSGMLISKYNAFGNKPYTLLRSNGPGGMERFQLDLDPIVDLTGDTILSTTDFDYLVATYDGSEMKTYVNGVIDKTISASGLIATEIIDLTIGKRLPVSVFYEGVIDEPRVSGGIARSADWIKTEYNNQNDNDVFWFKTPLLTNGIPNIIVDNNDDPIKVEP